MNGLLSRINIPLLPISILFGIGIIISLLTIAVSNMFDQQKNVYNSQIALINDVILQKLNSTEEATHGIRALFNASTNVDADEFRIVAGDVLSRHVFISDIIYMPLVLEKDRHDFEEGSRDQGFVTFAINQRQGDSLSPAPQNTRYFPIIYSEPFTPSSARNIGLDLLSDPALKPFMLRAIDTAGTSVSLPQQNGQTKQYMVFQALYAGKAVPSVLNERQQTVNGIVALVVNAEKLLDDVPRQEHLDYSLQIRSVLDDEGMVEVARSEKERHLEKYGAVLKSFNSKHDVQVGSQHYNIIFSKSLHWQDVIDAPIIISFVTGLALTALLMGLSVMATRRTKDLQNRNDEVRQLVEIRTRELASANQRLEHTAEELSWEKEEQQKLIDKLQETQTQLLQSEKMASIGQLAAGVAHEINNPVGYVNSNLGSLRQYIKELFQLLDAYENVCTKMEHCPDVADRAKPLLALKQELDLAYMKEDLVDLVGESQEGLDRVKKIVQDLKEFSHVDESEWQQVDIHQGIDSTLNIVNNELKYKADIVKEYADLPLVECMPSQINQVLMNLFVNAGHAMEERGTVTIRTGSQEEWVWIEISDTGKGIEPAVMKRIFEPFYTTKAIGEGTGLGLSVSFGIIEKHGGRIEVESEVDKGTQFRIWLPVQRRKEVA